MRSSSILNFARTPAASPLAGLVAELRKFNPPPKPDAMLHAERALAAAKAERQVALDAVKAAALAARDARSTENAPTLADVRQLEQRARAAEAPVVIARERLALASESWRREYAAASSAAAKPVRAALHDLIVELDAAINCIAEISARATMHGVNSPWLGRVAPQVIPTLRWLRDFIRTDRDHAE